MNILITGGAGYIGSHVVKQFQADKNINITIVDNLSGSSFDTISILKKLFNNKTRLQIKKIDLSNFQKVEDIFNTHQFDAVIHFAAHLQVGESVINPLKYYINNTLNTTNLIHLCIKYHVNKFIFSSTAAVYGEPKEIPIKETTPLHPINPYGMSKLMSERVLRDTEKAHKNFQYVILRYFNVAGASNDNSIGECHEPETHLIPLIVQTALGRRKKIMMFGDDYDTPDGSCIRDYVHIEDLANAHIEALKYLNNHNKSNIFNCGYGHGFSVKEVIETIKKISGVNFDVEITKRREGDPAVLISDNSKIKNEMKWKPKYDNIELICKSALKWEKKLQKNKDDND